MASTLNDIITLERAKQELGVLDNDRDERITGLISNAVDVVSDKSGVPLVVAETKFDLLQTRNDFRVMMVPLGWERDIMVSAVEYYTGDTALITGDKTRKDAPSPVEPIRDGLLYLLRPSDFEFKKWPEMHFAKAIASYGSEPATGSQRAAVILVLRALYTGQALPLEEIESLLN